MLPDGGALTMPSSHSSTAGKSSPDTTSTQRVFHDKVVVITGGGSGIGKALAHAFAKEGARVAVVDLKSSHAVANEIQRLYITVVPPLAFKCDVTNAEQVETTIRNVKETWGRIDIYCSNAGIIYPPKMEGNIARHSDDQWAKIMKVNVQSHVIAARCLLPDWQKEKNGTFCMTASAAGLLTQIGDASYGASKAAAVSFAEHLAIAHSAVQVHCLCPLAVDTPFVAVKSSSNSAMADGTVSAEYVADCTLDAIRKHEFWIFPHRQVPEYVRRKAMDHHRWINGMQRLKNRLPASASKGTRQSKL